MLKVTMRLIAIMALFQHCVYTAEYSWQEIDHEAEMKVTGIALSHTDQIYLGTLWNWIYRSDNSGHSWTECEKPEESPGVISTSIPIVSQMEMHPDGSIWVMGDIGFPRGVFMSPDQGQTWELEKYKNSDWFWHFDIVPNGDVYIATEEELLYKKAVTQDWLYLYDEYTIPYYDMYVSWLPNGNIQNQIFGHGSYASYLYKNNAWEQFNIGGPTEINSQGHLFAGGKRSVSAGISWQDIWNPAQLGNIRDMYIDANDVLFVVSTTGLYRSSDNGDTWEYIGLDNLNVLFINYNNQGKIAVVTGTMEQYIYATGRPFYYSTDCQIFLGTPPVAGTFSFKAPSAGQALKKLEQTEIQWEYTGNPGEWVRLDLYQGSLHIKNVVLETRNDKAYQWDVTRHVEPGVLYRFKITSLSDPGIHAFSSQFTITENVDLRSPGTYTAGRIPEKWIPVIDGNLNDPVWTQTDEDTLKYGDRPGDYTKSWNWYENAFVRWKAVWNREQNRIYAAVEIQDNIRGTFDNGENSGHYSPSDDESIEIMTDGNCDGGYYWGDYGSAQYWRVTAENHRNLLHYPSEGVHPFDDEGFETAVAFQENGNWTCEIEMIPYDRYPDIEKNLWEGGRIGWDIWYNDSDDETFNGGVFKNDRQIGWTYLGPAWRVADFSGDIHLGSMMALFPDTLLLQIDMDPAEGGTVTVAPEKTSYNAGEQVVLSAQPGSGYHFTHWSGDASGTLNPRTVIMDGYKHITAHFQMDEQSGDTLTLQVSVEPENSGTITVSPSQATYIAGTEVILSAQAANDYTFVSWSGDVTGRDNPITVIMDEHKYVTAHYILHDEPFSELEVTLPVMTANSEIFTVPVEIDDCEGMQVSYYHCQLTYDSDDFTLLSVTTQGCITEAWNSPDISYPDNQSLEVTQSGASHLEGSGILFQLIFQANVKASSAMDLVWDAFEFNEGNPIAITVNGRVDYTYTNVHSKSQEVPSEYLLHQNYPNPFNPVTRICYELPEAGETVLQIFSIHGKQVRVYRVHHQSPGTYDFFWDGLDAQGNVMSSGTYIYRLQCNHYEQYMKAVLIR